MSNPIKGLVDLYDESVKKSDDAGLAEVYKQATDLVFNALKKELKDHRKFDITIEDVEYLDGYFIFGKGTNSVVHFHIKETPGWKYGIWWSPVSKNIEDGEEDDENTEYYTDRVYCSIFAQYEEEIDKFKPSASMVCEEFTIDFKYPAANRLWAFADDIEFIHKEPYLAFYREMHYSDFNKEYVSRAKAKSYFERHFKQKKLEEETEALNNRELLKTIYTILKEDIDEGSCFIHDRGDNWSPRYEIIVKNTFDAENGCYRLFDILEEADAKEAQKLWDDAVKDCEKRAKKIGSYWYSSSCCHDSLILVSTKNFNEWFKEADIIDVKKLTEEA